jgi:sortase B
VLKAQNEDVVGWLYSADTPINYPILRGGSNDEYLHTLLNGKYNKAGSLFADYRMEDTLEEAYNYIIYGHNMKNDTMFGTLTEYKKQAYYEAHREIYLLTPDKSYRLKPYSGFVTKAGSEIIYKLDHNWTSLERYMLTIKDRSTFKNDLEYINGQLVVTLSTCAYDYDDARYVLVCIVEEL